MSLGLTRQRTCSLPLEVTGFVGRQRELAELGGLLGSARLVTVTGPGGVGKTRVALRAAAELSGEFADGACLIELSGLRDPELLPDTIATSLGLPGTEPGSQLDAIIEHLRDQRMLLILDTCEHLVDACAMLADVLLRATVVTVLATSRQPLAVPGEHTCAIAPLPVPDRHTRTAGDGDAVELFAQCAAAVVPGFAVTDANRGCVIRLCRRLDGVPLAIELATRRLRAIPLEQLADRLEDRFRLLTGGRRAALAHHQTIRAATEWSYDLCSPAEQLLWARLAVFVGSFDTEAVEQVCAGEPLERADLLATLIGLVDKSVVLRADGDGTRYLLLETIREFGAEKLAADSAEEAELRGRHIARHLALATALADDPTAEDQLPRYRRLWTEEANLRAALDYALAAPGRQRDAARLANALSVYWQMASSPGEGRFWLGRVLPLFWGPSRERALALINAGYLASLQGEIDDGIASLEKGLAVAGQLQDTGACARGYLYLSSALTFAGRHHEAAVAGVRAYEFALTAGDASVLITLDAQAGSLHVAAGEVEEGLARCNRGLDRLGAGSEERWQQSYLLALKGFCLLLKGDFAGSGEAFCTALDMKHEIGDTMGTSYALEGIAWLAVAEQRWTRAAWLLGAADSLWQLVGSRLASSATRQTRHARAEQEVRDALGEERYLALRHQGGGYALADIVQLAAEGADELPPPGGVAAGVAARGGAAFAGAVGPAAAAAIDAGTAGLTSREWEIAGLVAEGLSNREIAGRLVISKRTVDAHIEHIYGKIGVSSRVRLASWLRTRPAE
ncbi:MAG TPA: LuxR C-terminal-related transcriptional regulator [Streptosporangiaceae bacterium]